MPRHGLPPLLRYATRASALGFGAAIRSIAFALLRGEIAITPDWRASPASGL